MLEITKLEEVRGNNVTIFAIKTMLERKSYPKLSIMSGVIGVGKTSVARIVASQLDKSGMPVVSFNFGAEVNMDEVNQQVFSLNPSQPKVFIFEELQGLSRDLQQGLMQMIDTQPANVYIICTTSEIHKVLRAIRSRSRIWEFKLLSDKQCAQLLDDYLELKGVQLSTGSKQSLLRACRGVPRDLLMNADLAIDGNFSTSQLDALLDNVSDQLTFTLFCALKSKTADFVSHIEELMEESSTDKLAALRDFWLRYVLERSASTRQTLSPEMIKALDALFSVNEINKVARTLLRSTADTVLLELVSLNMSLTESNSATVLGQQRDTAHKVEQEVRAEKQRAQRTPESAQLTADSVKGFTL